jgi:polyhydroxyalkanoate synthesis regulator protein
MTILSLFKPFLFRGEFMKTFKKYANRKLYSVEKKGYVNLPEILSLAKAGESIQVLTHGEGRDITEETIREAIFRGTKLPISDLLTMVREQ